MLSAISSLLEGIPPLAKEIILIIVGIIALCAAWTGGAARDRIFSLAQ